MSMAQLYHYFLAFSRWLTAAATILLAVSWVHYFIKNRQKKEILAFFKATDGHKYAVTHHEFVLGRGRKADLSLPSSGARQRHAVLYFDDGRWIISPLGGQILCNGKAVQKPTPVYYGDKITVAGCDYVFDGGHSGKDISSNSNRPTGPVTSLLLLNIFQFVTAVEAVFYCLSVGQAIQMPVLGFVGLMVFPWIYYFAGKHIQNFKLFVEIPVFYLSTLGLSVYACSVPERLNKQMLCYAAGFVGYLVLCFILCRFPARIVLQRAAMIGSVGLLYYTAFFGTEINSSRNWLVLGGFSFQPCELCKVAFVFAGCSALYTVLRRPKRRLEFLIYSALCMGALALMLDFGAVAIFFVGMLVLLILRQTNPLFIGLICAGSVGGGALLLTIYPYIARRFAVWTHAWQYAGTTGYQQTRTMVATASGGLLGVGPGNGYLTGISAAETDLIFGVIGEEFGAIVAVAAALCFVALGVYAYRLAMRSTSLFYACGVCGAAVMIIFQTALNIFGSLDLLPLTGVTMIFVSCGGTSVIAAWMMLSFFKAAEICNRTVDEWEDE